MQSLRTRRSQAPRKGQRAPQAGAPSSAKPVRQDTTRLRDARKSRVDDKIKKRMSMRYADISSPTELNGVPPMPSLPIGVGSAGRGAVGRDQDEVVKDRTDAKEDAKARDKKLLDKEDFDPDAYLKIKLANSTESELKSLQSSLRGTKDDTASELQRNVFKNYAEFVLISKEISTLENEMLELKESLSEYKSMPSLLHIPDPTSVSSSHLSTYKRSSVADLRIMYFNQMQTLHAQIEGSAKFAPTTPGRHVVGEVEGVLALNTATYKVVGKVKFVVLDDAVLVARRRRRNAGGNSGTANAAGGEGKLVAERCWPLSEMLVLDTKDSPSMTNVFKIRHGKETHVYRTESPADKKALLSQFRHVAEELAAKKRKEREGEHERRKSMWNGGGGDRSGVPPVPDWMADLARRAGDTGVGTDAKEKAEKDARWVGEWSDELTVAIALREWEKAVELVEKGKAKLSTTPPLAAKLPGLTAQLTTSLLNSLSLSTNRKTTAVSLISLLSRLGAGAAARTTFLNMRTEVIRKYVRKIRFEGHVGVYVGDLAVVCFTGIKHTADWFLASFKENEVASSFIDWARKEIEHYAEMFRKQVYISDVDPKTVEEALRITYSQSKKLLQDYGLDFRFLLDELLVEKPKDMIKSPPPFSFRAHQMPKHDSIRTPTTTPTNNRSPDVGVTSLPPMPSSTYTPSSSTSSSTYNTVQSSSYTPPPNPAPAPSASRPQGVRTPMSALPTAPASAPMPVAAPAPRRARSPPLSASPQRPSVSSTRPPRSLKGSPAPPPRSRDRPGSAVNHRPPPVAVPQREGMI